VNQLRQLMLEELRRRNFAETTIRTYIHGVEHFSRYFRRRPDQLGPEDIRKYQAALFTQFKFSPNTVILRLASLRFFYIHVLKRNWSIAETPYPKKLRHLPGVFSQEEVGRLIDAADTPFHRILLMTLYATGARRAEAARLKVNDIDSQRMVVHIHEGKGGKDRDVMLSPKLAVRRAAHYWRGLRRKPKEWLFPGNRWHTAIRGGAREEPNQSPGAVQSRASLPHSQARLRIREGTLPRLEEEPRSSVRRLCTRESVSAPQTLVTRWEFHIENFLGFVQPACALMPLRHR
jgi:integrase/recombinase XerD